MRKYSDGGTTDYSHYVTAVAALFNQQGDILILQRGSTAPWMPNAWSLVGGVVDEGENPDEAIVREIMEETGLVAHNLQYKQTKYTKDAGKIVYYAGMLPANFIVRLDYENQDFAFVNLSNIDQYEYVPHVKAFMRNLLEPPIAITKLGRGGKIVAEQNVRDKFKRAGITDKYEIETLNEIDLANTKFDRDSLLKAIDKAYDDLGNNYKDYLISEDSQAITNAIQNDINARYVDGDTDENMRELEKALNSSWTRSEYIRKYQNTQIDTALEWINYLDKSTYPSAFRYLILKALLNYNYDFKTDTIIKRTNKTTRNLTPFDAGTLAQIWDRKSDYLLQDYTLQQIENAEAIAKAREIAVTSTGGKWLLFKGGDKATKEEIKNNAKELSQLVQDTYWCTKTAAKSQLDNGDFYVYVTEAQGKIFPRIAIRMEGDKVGEVRGNASSAQDIEPEMLPIAEDFLANNIPNDSGKKWLEAVQYNRKAMAMFEVLKSNGLYKGCVEEFMAIKKDENKFTVDYAQRNGHVVRIEILLQDLLLKPNNIYAPKEVVFDVSDFDNQKTRIILGDADFYDSEVGDLGSLQMIGGKTEFSDSQVKDLGNLQMIGGDVYFENSQIKDLGNLHTIGGDANFYHSQVQDLGNLQTIGGMANFTDSLITHLANLKTIGASAYFTDSQVKDLGNLQTIGGMAEFSDSQVKDLGNLHTIGGDANFYHSQVQDLGNLQMIGGDVLFAGSQVQDLGNLQTIGGMVNFTDSLITHLANLKTIGASAYFTDSQVKDLGNLQMIGGDVLFAGSQVQDLGNLQIIGKSAYFGNSQVQDLGNLQVIGELANFGDSIITNLGNLHTIGGDVAFAGSQVQDLGNLQTIGGDANFRYSKITHLGNLQSIGGYADFRSSQIKDLGNLQYFYRHVLWHTNKEVLPELFAEKFVHLKHGKYGDGYYRKNMLSNQLAEGGIVKKYGFTEAEIDRWEKENKVSQRKTQNPVVKEAITEMAEGKLTQDEYIKILQKNNPIKPFDRVPPLPTLKEIVGSLKTNQLEKQGIIGYTVEIPDGAYVASRLDIPAYDNYDVWVVSVHDGNKEKNVIGYGKTAYLKNVTFKSSPKTAMRIGMGLSSKSTFARMYGTWVNKSPEVVRNMAVRYINNPNWIQVGMNPYRHSWFYDKADGLPLVSAEEVIQVGALVLAKNAVKTTVDDPEFIVDDKKPAIKYSDGGNVKNQSNSFSDKTYKLLVKATKPSSTEINKKNISQSDLTDILKKIGREKDFINYANQKGRKNYICEYFDEHKLTHGFCNPLAYYLMDRYNDLSVFSAKNDVDGNHLFVKLGDKYFDGKNIYGVNNPRDLDFFSNKNISIKLLETNDIDNIYAQYLEYINKPIKSRTQIENDLIMSVDRAIDEHKDKSTKYSDGGKTGSVYYRATSEDMGKQTVFTPVNKHEAFDDEGNPLTRGASDVFVLSDIPEISASKTIGGAILGLWSMFNHNGINPVGKKIYIYEIMDRPRKDLSHVRMADFEYLKEVRYDKPVNGVRSGYFVFDTEFNNNALNFYERLNDDDPYSETQYDEDAWYEFEKYILTLNNNDIVKYADGGELVTLKKAAFIELPKKYQIGILIRAYEVNEDVDWSINKSITDWVNDKDVNTLIKDYAKHYPNRIFAFGLLPVKYLISKIEKTSVLDDYNNFNEYHKNYSYSNYAKHENAEIPILIDDREDEFIEDGWHRFHRYIDMGMVNIPVVSYNPNIEITNHFSHGGLVAPNGKPSNLTHEQWHLVRTPEFKAWFGDWENNPQEASKVVDANGEPLIVYRGDASNRYVFNEDTFFSSNDYVAGSYSNEDAVPEYEVFLNIRNPLNLLGGNELRFNPNGSRISGSDPYVVGIFKKAISEMPNDYVVKVGWGDEWDKKTLLNAVIRNHHGIEYIDYNNQSASWEAIIKYAKKQGYDGVFMYDESIDKLIQHQISQIVFHPTQIKLADGSNTTFDGNNSDIRYADGGKIRPFINDGNKLVVFNQYRNYIPYKIAVDDVNDAEYITLWKTDINTNIDKKVGYLRLNTSYDGFLSVSEISIDKDSRGLGLGLEMYKTALKYSSDEVKGIKSYLPNRSNIKQIPKIYRKLNSVEDGDYEFIYKEKNPDIKFAEGGKMNAKTNIEGEYSSLRHFISSNANYRKILADIYGIEESEVEESLDGELGYDEEVLNSLLGSDYRIFYNEENDEFEITKRRKGSSASAKIVLSNSNNANQILEAINKEILTEYEPRFGVMYNGKIVGGSTYHINNETYYFDIALSGKARGLGISKMLISSIIEDAKSLGVKNLQADIVNPYLLTYLQSIGFSVYKSQDQNIATYTIDNNEDIKHKDGGVVNNLIFSVENPEYKDAFFSRGDENEDTWLEYGKQSIQRTIDEVKGLKFPLTIYRGVPDEYLTNYDEIKGDYGGENRSWTTSKYVALEFSGDNGYIASKTIDESDIDYESTITRRIIHNALDEDEINLNDKGASKLTHIQKANSIFYHKGGKTETLLAPNGNPSNLTPEQWHLVRTPAFKAWFGDWENDPENASKVVDENGEPLVVWHGGDVDTVFDLHRTDFGFHFGSKNQAIQRLAMKNRQGNVKPYFLNIRNYISTEDAGWWVNLDFWSGYVNIDDETEESQISIIGILITDGYDGVEYENYTEGKGISWIAFYPEQIKLADGSNTTFDGNNPDIRYAEGGMTDNIIIGIAKDVVKDIGEVYDRNDSIGKCKEISEAIADRLNIAGIEAVAMRIIDGKDTKYGSTVINHAYVFLPLTHQIVDTQLWQVDGTPTDIQTRKVLFDYDEYNSIVELYDVEPISEFDSRTKDIYGKGGKTDTLLAPNGKPSNLTPEQWHLVRTPAFKAWFGDWENDPENASKVVDENGEPKICYHATPSSWNIAKIMQNDIGVHFGTKSQAEDRMRQQKIKNYIIIEAFLNAKYPIYSVDKKSWFGSNLAEILSKNKIEKSDIMKNELDILKAKYKYDETGKIVNNWSEKALIEWNDNNKKRLYSSKYDSIIYINKYEDKSNRDFSYILFHPTQIKLADGTNTTFDGSNPDIRYSNGGVFISKSRLSMPSVRGSWTKEKILRYLKSKPSDTISTYGLTYYISQFDSWEQFKDHIYYHGTTNYPEKGLKPSIVFSERFAEQMGGGGYGQRYWGISLTKRKRTAESFSGMYNHVTVYPVILKKDAKVIERTDLQDASEIEDIIVELYEQGVDAVWIGGGEEELVVVNPNSILLYKRGSDTYSVLGGFKSQALTDEQIIKIYDDSKKLWEEYSAKRNEIKDLKERTAYLQSLEPIKFSRGGKINIDDYMLVTYHEKVGNWAISKNEIYLWLYDDMDAGNKLQSGEFDYVLFPPRLPIQMAFKKNYVPPLLQVWTKKYQNRHKGSNKLMAIISAWYDETNHKLYILMMTTRKDLRKRGIISSMIKELRKKFNIEQEDVIFDDPTEEGKAVMESKKFDKGGKTETSRPYSNLDISRVRKGVVQLHSVHPKRITKIDDLPI